VPSGRRPLTPVDVRSAAEWATGVLAAVPAGAWATPVGEWTARRVLDHIVDALLFHAALVSRRATGRVTPPRNGDPTATPADLLDALTGAAALHAAVLAELGDGERAFHPAGRADREGWVGLACTEVLVHTADIAGATGTPLPEVPGDLADAVVERVLPWTPPHRDGWARLLQATGRRSLGDVPPPAADWWWQAAPLGEWDGTPRRRTVPPQW
jgi:uncharacterized protein (TIGR03083 family)